MWVFLHVKRQEHFFGFVRFINIHYYYYYYIICPVPRSNIRQTDRQINGMAWSIQTVFALSPGETVLDRPTDRSTAWLGQYRQCLPCPQVKQY